MNKLHELVEAYADASSRFSAAKHSYERAEKIMNDASHVSMQAHFAVQAYVSQCINDALSASEEYLDSKADSIVARLER